MRGAQSNGHGGTRAKESGQTKSDSVLQAIQPAKGNRCKASEGVIQPDEIGHTERAHLSGVIYATLILCMASSVQPRVSLASVFCVSKQGWTNPWISSWFLGEETMSGNQEEVLTPKHLNLPRSLRSFIFPFIFCLVQ